MKIHLRILSMLIVAFMFVTMMPAISDVAYAASSVEYAAFDNWAVTTAHTHAKFEASGNGVKITQTKQTRYKEGTTTSNSSWDGTVSLGLYKDLVDTGNSNSVTRTNGYRGNVKLTIKYKINNVDESAAGGSYYNMIIPGYVYIRIKNNSVTVLNSGSTSSNTVKDGLFSGLKSGETENTIVVNIDTEKDTFTFNVNGSTKIVSGDAEMTGKGKEPKGYVDSITIQQLQRAAVGAYLEITSVAVESDEDQDITLSDETKKIIETFPAKLAADPNNVTSNVTLPWDVPGIQWVTSNDAVMNEYGKITRKSASDPTYVEISYSFMGKTNDGKDVPIKQVYKMNVTGLSNAVAVTSTVNPSSDPNAEKWYQMPQRGEIEDGYPIFDDPMYISDEAFFGKWNSATGKWTLTPYFRYSEFPDMAKVEAAAKAGNYELAKTEIQDYYRRHFEEKASYQTSINAKNLSYHRLMYEYLSRNAYPVSYISSFPINIFTINKNKSEITIDVTNRLSEAIGSFTCFSTMIASIDKYKNQAKIYSKESSTPPVLIVELTDGTKHTCPVIKDSYIQAGSYSKTNYGSEKVLLAEESGIHRNHDDRTKRAYIGFDISKFKKGKKVQNAYVKITAEHTGSDPEKLMLLYWHCDSSWNEEYVCFDTFSEHFYFSANDMNCWDYVTSNNTTIKGKTCGYHRGGEVGSLCDLYAYMNYLKKTGKTDSENFDADYDKYGYTTIRQHMALINAIGVEPDVMNSLDNSGHIATIALDMLRLIDSPYMTSNRFTAFLKHLWLATEHKNYDEYRVHYNNWATYSTGAVYQTCARYPEFARYNDWLECTRVENERVTNDFIFEDGMSLELSQGYTNTLLSTFNSPYSLIQDYGGETPYNENTENVIYNLCMSLFKQSAPGGGGFGFGDSTNPYSTQQSLFSKWYNNLFKGDPIIAYMAGKTGGWLPENATTNFPVGQRTFMRSSWEDDAVAMGITNKMKGSHGHKDALSVSMYAYGKFLLVDPGYGAILTGNIRNYMISPQQHNMVTVNDNKNYLDPETNAIDPEVKNNVKTLESKDGVQKKFDSNLHYDFVEYSTDAFTTTELSQRSVTFLKDLKAYIITDYIIPNDATASNEYTQNWHLYPGSKMTFDSDKVTRTNFVDEPNVMLVPVAPEEIDSVKKVKTLFSEDTGQFIDSEKAVYWKTKTGNTSFNTIILPMNTGEDYEVKTKRIASDLDKDVYVMFSFEVTNKNTDETRYFIYYHTNDTSTKQTVKVGGYETDAQTMLVEQYETGFIKSMYMVDGTFISKSGRDSIRTTEEMSVAFTLDNKVLDCSVIDQKADVLEKIQFNASLANKVMYDGNEFAFEIEDGNIKFTDVVVPEEPNYDPHAGKLIYDSAVNPELINLNPLKPECFTATNLGKDGIKFETVKSIPYDANGAPSGTSNAVARLRLSGIIDDIAENASKGVTDLMSGVYAVDFTIQQRIDSARMENGKVKDTFSTMAFGMSDDKLSSMNSLIEFRLYTNQLNIIRTASTQKDYIRADLNNVALQDPEADKEWKLRVVFDTVNKKYTVFVNDYVARGATDFPYNVVAKQNSETGEVTWTEKPGNHLPDFQITMMQANTVGSYVWIKNMKIYEIERAAEDPRVKDLYNRMPLKLYAGNPNLVDGSITMPENSKVTWTSSNPEILGIDGVLRKKVTEPTPITFEGVTTIADTEGTKRTFTYKRTYNMTVVSPSTWTLSATATGATVKASVSSMNENYGLQPPLMIVGYDAKGKICDMHIKPVSEKLTDYTYEVKNNPSKIKVFLLENLNSALPLTKNISFK